MILTDLLQISIGGIIAYILVNIMVEVLKKVLVLVGLMEIHQE